MNISIIIPALNEAQRIGDVIQNVRERAKGQIFEVIVADGGSDDRTTEIAQQKGAILINCEKSGRAAQMNCGAKAAGGDIHYFLHADTIPPAGFDCAIETAVVNGAGAGCFRLEFSSEHPLLRFYSWCTRFNLNVFRFGDQSLFVTRELFAVAGGFDETLTVMEDQQMVRDLSAKNKFTVLGESVCTSARKYHQNGVIRLQLIFTIILILYYCGASQEVLVHFYHSAIDTKEPQLD